MNPVRAKYPVIRTEPLPPSRQLEWKDRVIEIHVDADGYFSVRECNIAARKLTWDEMLGHVASMTIPRHRVSRTGLFSMITDQAEWEYYHRFDTNDSRRKLLDMGCLKESPFDTVLDR